MTLDEFQMRYSPFFSKQFNCDLDTLIASEREDERGKCYRIARDGETKWATGPTWNNPKQIAAREIAIGILNLAAPPDALYRRDETCAQPWVKTRINVPAVGVKVEARWNHRPGESWTAWRSNQHSWELTVIAGPQCLCGTWTCEPPDEWRPIEGGEPAKEISEDEEAAAYYEIKCNELGQANSRLKAELAAANSLLEQQACQMARTRAELSGLLLWGNRVLALAKEKPDANGSILFE